MNAVNPDGNSGSLSISEAAAAYANAEPDEEAPEGQSEPETEASDETAGTDTPDEGDEQADPENEGQAEDEPEPEPEAPAYVAPEAKVKLEDGTEATVADLIKGNLRDKDYRQKTMALGELERSYKSKSEQVTQYEQQLAGDRDFMVQLIQSIMPQRPDPSMYSVDPIGYGEADLAYRTRKEQLDYLMQTQSYTAEQRKAQEAETVKDTRKREWEATLEHMPELKDGNRLNSFVGEIQKAATDYGYTPQEIQNVGLDHRQVLVLRDAIKWRNLQASKSKIPAKVEGRPPVQRAGTRQSPDMQRGRDVRVAMDRLKSTGSLKDGIAALLATEKG